MARPPQAIREAVVARLYAEFDAMRWEQLPTREKSDAYERFLTDPEVGAPLITYMDPGSIRVWIKDGPAKEYLRALEGVGNYAKYTNRAFSDTENLIRKALGADWSLSGGSLADKPMRCEAASSCGQRRFVMWGPFAALKELVWHALLQRVQFPAATPLLVVTRPTIAPLQTSQRNQAERMCDLIGAEFRSIVRLASTKA
jgi:hypothetical protein